jgi:hypothetical protein
MTTKGKIDFNSCFQRNLVWDKYRKSLFIHSLIYGYPVPALFVLKMEDGKYAVVDGKQRSNCVVGFMNNEFALTLDEDYQKIELEDATVCDIQGKTFEELDEEIQDQIRDFSFTVYYFEDEEEVEEVYFRLNNGKAQTAFDLTWAKALSKEEFMDIANHEIFSVALTPRSLASGNNRKIAMYAYMTVYQDRPSYTDKDMRPIVSTTKVTKEQVAHIREIFDKLLNVYNLNVKSYPKQSKTMLRKTHLASLTKFASNLSQDKLREFILGFYDGEHRAASVSETYNRNCQYGVAKPDSIEKRLNEMSKYYNNHIANKVNINELLADNKTNQSMGDDNDVLLSDIENDIASFNIDNMPDDKDVV